MYLRHIHDRLSSQYRLALTLPILLIGCGTTSDVDPELAKRVESMFQAVYSKTAAVYVDLVDLRRFTIAGLDGLRRIDTGYQLTVEDDNLRMAILDRTIAREPLLPEDSSVEDWAEFAQSMLLQAKTSGSALGAASEESLYEQFINSALRSLDRFSRYANPGAAAELKAEREGFGGIGADIQSDPDGARITRIEPDKPADAAGLLPGDRIVAIDTIRIAGRSQRQVERMLRGPVDRALELTIKRSDLPEPIDVIVGRTRIIPNTVHLSRLKNHAVIRVSGFNERTSTRIMEALNTAKREIGADLSGIILDLRGNLGGLLHQAIDSADLFLNSGLISRSDGRHPNSHQRFYAKNGDAAEGLPLVVLIDGASASAAEILAAALQDHGRAVVIGMSSFGKGSIQTVTTLPNGGELYITWARFVAPSGYALQRLGVMPTICTSGASDAVATLNTALGGSGDNNGRALLSRRRALDLTDDSAVMEMQALCRWQPHASGDIDTTIAELLLESPMLMRQGLTVSRMPDGA